VSLDLSRVSGAGNGFGLVDVFRGEEPAQPAAIARALGAEHGLDGLLLLAPPRAGGVARFEVFNADGSRAAACGNGLRCAARRWFEDVALGIAPPFEGDSPWMETAAGARRFELLDWFEERAVLRVSMGVPRELALDRPLRHRGEELSALGLELGNHHLVLRVRDERDAPVEELGHSLQSHPLFPDGVNVGFLARRAGGWHLRVFERGVGETRSCGSGACAAAVASGELERGELSLRLPGGELSVARDASGELWLSGEALEHGALEPSGGALASLSQRN
jgi:diaminopimelate epimerase